MKRRFNRFELKYVISVEHARRIMDDLADRAGVDPHGTDGTYRLLSLYYDSPSRECFWAKVEGLKFRRKLRLRIYVPEDITSVKTGIVEIKQRINRTVQKRRLALPLADAEALCDGEFPSCDLDAFDTQVASEVGYLVKAMHFAPACITAYRRRAFVGGEYDPGLRVTFDTDVRYRVHALKVNLDATNHLLLPPDVCIMEVKADERIPDWTTSLLSRHGCRIQRVSKYCAAIARVLEQSQPSSMPMVTLSAMTSFNNVH